MPWQLSHTHPSRLGYGGNLLILTPPCVLHPLCNPAVLHTPHIQAPSVIGAHGDLFDEAYFYYMGIMLYVCDVCVLPPVLPNTLSPHLATIYI